MKTLGILYNSMIHQSEHITASLLLYSYLFTYSYDKTLEMQICWHLEFSVFSGIVRLPLPFLFFRLAFELVAEDLF